MDVYNQYGIYSKYQEDCLMNILNQGLKEQIGPNYSNNNNQKYNISNNFSSRRYNKNELNQFNTISQDYIKPNYNSANRYQSYDFSNSNRFPSYEYNSENKEQIQLRKDLLGKVTVEDEARLRIIEGQNRISKIEKNIEKMTDAICSRDYFDKKKKKDLGNLNDEFYFGSSNYVPDLANATQDVFKGKSIRWADLAKSNNQRDKNKKASLEEQIDTLDKQIKEKQKSLESEKEQNGEYQEQVNEIEQKISKLKDLGEQIEKLEENKKFLQYKLKESENIKDENNNLIAELKTEVDELRKKLFQQSPIDIIQNFNTNQAN